VKKLLARSGMLVSRSKWLCFEMRKALGLGWSGAFLVLHNNCVQVFELWVRRLEVD
jgi:hypothetical protein